MAHDRPCPPQEVVNLQRLAGARPLLLGCDANSRHTLWGSSETNERGESLFQFIINSKFRICNRGSTPTFIFPSTPDFCGWEEVLDLTLLTEGSLKVNKWRVSDEETLSDHRRILFELNIAADTPTPFRNPRKTDWDLFQKVIEKELKNLPVEDIPTRGELDAKADGLNKAFGKALTKACPLTYGKKARTPWWNENLTVLRKQVRKSFNECYRNKVWDLYKENLKKYKKRYGMPRRRPGGNFANPLRIPRNLQD